MKDIRLCETEVSLRGALNQTSEAQMDALVAELKEKRRKGTARNSCRVDGGLLLLFVARAGEHRLLWWRGGGGVGGDRRVEKKAAQPQSTSVAVLCVQLLTVAWTGYGETTYLPILHGLSYLPSLWQFALQICRHPHCGRIRPDLKHGFLIYLPYRFSAIYFSAMWTATAPSATAVTT